MSRRIRGLAAEVQIAEASAAAAQSLAQVRRLEAERSFARGVARRGAEQVAERRAFTSAVAAAYNSTVQNHSMKETS